MVAELIWCTKCMLSTGQLVSKDQFQTDLCWGQMKCGGCQLRWHVCLQHILRWLWEDVAKACDHFRLPCHNLSKSNDPSIHNEYDVIMQEGLSVSCLSSPTVISSDALNPVKNNYMGVAFRRMVHVVIRPLTTPHMKVMVHQTIQHH